MDLYWLLIDELLWQPCAKWPVNYFQRRIPRFKVVKKHWTSLPVEPLKILIPAWCSGLVFVAVWGNMWSLLLLLPLCPSIAWNALTTKQEICIFRTCHLLWTKAIGYLEIILDITNASTRMGVAVPPKEIIIFILCNTANSSNFFSED